jgi:uncharacterized protein YjbJ (UPF0337 family)
MRVSDLKEADDFADFSAQAGGVVDKFAKLAGGAYNRFKGAKEKAEAGIQGDMEKAQSNAERAAEKAERDAEKAEKDAEKGRGAKQKALGETIPQLVAKVVLDRTPDDPDMIEEFHGLDAEQFNQVYAAIDKSKERLSKFPRELRKVLKSSDFLQAQSRTDQELNDMLGEQPDKGMEPAEEMLMKDLYDEQAAWSQVLTSDDAAGSAQHMAGLIKAISRDFTARNQANTGAGKAKSYPEGTGIVRLISSQRQLIAMRLGLLQGSIEQLSHKPITEAALRRVRRLLEQM